MESPLDDHAYTGDPPKTRQLPSDLPTSLDDRRHIANPMIEEEMYDGWQGQSQFLTTPMPARPLSFNLALDEPSFGDEDIQQLEDSDSRLVQMLAHQARLKNDSGSGDEAKVVADDKLSSDEKREALQGLLTLAASNGELDRVRRLMNGKAKEYIDVNTVDAEGTPPLVYASCFGHEDVVATLIEAGADVDRQDKNRWSPLMWAMTNRHKGIVKILLDHGASPEVKSSTGRTAFDFVEPNSEISEYLHESGYTIGNAGVTDDFYNSGFSQDRFEEEMAENEMKRRMMMESAINLEVDLGNLGLDEQPESPEEQEEGQEFVWDRCLNDQMFVFQESELDRILDIIITNMTPQRSPSQKPVPANILFLSARYAYYHSSPELLETLLVSAMDKINDVVEKHQWDMTILAFWMSNATLLLHYLKKDAGLVQSTTEFQLQLVELINEIFILIIRDAERRMDKVLDQAMLEHETIPGFEDVHFQHEWKIFRTKPKVKPLEPIEKRFRPPSPKRRAQPSPRNITSLLSSTLFVLDIYDIHSVITAQILSQLIYWLSAELFNRIMSNRKYLARTKAMQIRMNVSTLEDWARSNNRQPEHYENGSMTSTGDNTMESARRHLEPLVQLLQWLQCFSSLGEDLESLVGTLQQLPRLTPQQLLHAAKYYRPEVGEKGLPKSASKYIIHLQKAAADRKATKAKARESLGPSPNPQQQGPDSTPSTPVKPNSQPISSPSPAPSKQSDDEKDDAPDDLLLDPSYMLPFSLPTSTDMLISYGAGFGGVNKERERKYIPTVPPEFLAKLDLSGGRNSGSLYDNTRWEEQNYG
ncbi:ankyrin [Zopfia rhizophila CBS 207.26]|uniref:Ankyrin n=1 Tax=Zopfia rhizophila CBS 207.26 TaxID=1314779 RepID=A0A6A6EUP8_9PEZI|nr:ankyrin [Zopfia rhizophila CBS 207.26]